MLGEELLRIVLRDSGVNDDVLSRLPVDGRGDLVLVGQLESCIDISTVMIGKRSKLRTVNGTKDLVEVAAGRRRVGDQKTNGLLGVDDEHRADGERNAL